MVIVRMTNSWLDSTMMEMVMIVYIIMVCVDVSKQVNYKTIGVQWENDKRLQFRNKFEEKDGMT